MRTIILSISLFLGLSCSAQDKPFEKIFLKNGTKVEGYISSQTPGSSMLITPSWVEVVIPDSCVSITNTEEQEVSALSKEWQEWAKNNPNHVNYKNGKEYMTLFYITYKTNSVWSRFRNLVKIIERGEVVKFVSPCKDSESAPLEVYGDTVVRIERTLRERELLSGVVDVLVTKKGVIKGQIVEIVPGKTITVLDDNGIRQTVLSKDVQSQGREFLNTKQNWKQQVPYLDEVRTKKGVFSGVITKQTYNQEKNTFTLLGTNDISEFIQISDVLSIYKTKNKDYKPIYLTTLSENEVSVCGKKIIWSKIDDKRSKLILASANNAAYIDLDSISGHAIIEMLNIEENKGIRVYKAKDIDKKGLVWLETSESYESELPVSVENEDNQTISYSLPKLLEGCYIIQRTDDRKTAAFVIEKKK